MLSVLVALTGPAQAQTERPADDPHQAVAEFLPSCAPRFAQIDARVAEAGVGDASYRRVEGFPYLRTDRLMSSYDRELDDPDKLDAWLLQLRDNDNFSRDIELRNLGLDTRERSTLLLDMRLCAVWLSFMETGAPERLRAMIRAVRKTAEAAPSAAPPEHADAPASGRATRRVWRAAANDEAIFVTTEDPASIRRYARSTSEETHRYELEGIDACWALTLAPTGILFASVTVEREGGVVDEILALDAQTLQPRFRFGTALGATITFGCMVVEGEELFVCDSNHDCIRVFSLQGEHRRDPEADTLLGAGTVVFKRPEELKADLVGLSDFTYDEPIPCGTFKFLPGPK